MHANRYLTGAVAGVLATVPMTAVMVGLFRYLPRSDRYPLPPRELTDEVAHRIGIDKAMDESQQVALALTAHFAYGGLTGAFYPLSLRLSGPRKELGQARVAHTFQMARRNEKPVILLVGAGYGVVIWALSYLGWIPAFKLLAPATRHPPPRRRLMIAAHLVWGTTTVMLGEWLAQRLREK